MRAGLLGQPLRRPLGIFQVPGRGELESSVIVVWISLGCGYRAKNILDLDQPTCLVTHTNVDIRNNGTALSVFSCSNTSPDASAFLQVRMHACRYFPHLMDPMQGVRTLYAVESLGDVR
jgi:hypothetical protein